MSKQELYHFTRTEHITCCPRCVSMDTRVKQTIVLPNSQGVYIDHICNRCSFEYRVIYRFSHWTELLD